MSKNPTDGEVIDSIIRVHKEFENYLDKLNIDDISDAQLLELIHSLSKTEELVEDLYNYKRKKDGKDKLH